MRAYGVLVTEIHVNIYSGSDTSARPYPNCRTFFIVTVTQK